MTAESFKKYLLDFFEMCIKLNINYDDINTKNSLFVNKKILILPALKEVVFCKRDCDVSIQDSLIDFDIKNLNTSKSFKQFCDYLDSRDVTFEEIIIELNSVLVKHL